MQKLYLITLLLVSFLVMTHILFQSKPQPLLSSKHHHKKHKEYKEESHKKHKYFRNEETQFVQDVNKDQIQPPIRPESQVITPVPVPTPQPLPQQLSEYIKNLPGLFHYFMPTVFSPNIDMTDPLQKDLFLQKIIQVLKPLYPQSSQNVEVKTPTPLIPQQIIDEQIETNHQEKNHHHSHKHKHSHKKEDQENQDYQQNNQPKTQKKEQVTPQPLPQGTIIISVENLLHSLLPKMIDSKIDFNDPLQKDAFLITLYSLLKPLSPYNPSPQNVVVEDEKKPQPETDQTDEEDQENTDDEEKEQEKKQHHRVKEQTDEKYEKDEDDSEKHDCKHHHSGHNKHTCKHHYLHHYQKEVDKRTNNRKDEKKNEYEDHKQEDDKQEKEIISPEDEKKEVTPEPQPSEQDSYSLANLIKILMPKDLERQLDYLNWQLPLTKEILNKLFSIVSTQKTEKIEPQPQPQPQPEPLPDTKPKDLEFKGANIFEYKQCETTCPVMCDKNDKDCYRAAHKYIKCFQNTYSCQEWINYFETKMASDVMPQEFFKCQKTCEPEEPTYREIHECNVECALK